VQTANRRRQRSRRTSRRIAGARAPLKDSRELARKIGSMAPGSSVNLSIVRNGEEKTLALTLGEAPMVRKAHSGTEQSAIPASQGGQFGLTLAVTAGGPHRPRRICGSHRGTESIEMRPSFEMELQFTTERDMKMLVTRV
jgi:hypothetical protein